MSSGQALASGAMGGAGRRPGRTIVLAGLVGGACDITYAFVVSALRGVSPVRVSQSVAAGLLGRDAAFSGGLPVAALGLALHFSMAIVMAAFYYFAATKIPVLAKRATLFGPLYGLGLYLFMNRVVIPLSAIGPRPWPPAYIVITEALVHMFLVGLVIALFTRRALVRT